MWEQNISWHTVIGKSSTSVWLIIILFIPYINYAKSSASVKIMFKEYSAEMLLASWHCMRIIRGTAEGKIQFRMCADLLMYYLFNWPETPS